MNNISIYQDAQEARIVFHFNKASNTDLTIAPWVVKHRGATWNVWHMDSTIGFSTKETPDSEHTKGSLQFKGKLTIYLDEHKHQYAEIR